MSSIPDLSLLRQLIQPPLHFQSAWFSFCRLPQMGTDKYPREDLYLSFSLCTHVTPRPPGSAKGPQRRGCDCTLCPFNQVLLGERVRGRSREGERSFWFCMEKQNMMKHFSLFKDPAMLQLCRGQKGRCAAGAGRMEVGSVWPEASENGIWGVAEGSPLTCHPAWKLAISSGPLGLFQSSA